MANPSIYIYKERKRETERETEREKCLKIYDVSNIKKINKDYEKSSWNISKYFLRRKIREWQYGRERCKNHSEDKKQMLVEYKKYIIEWRITLYCNYKKVFYLRKFYFFIGKMKQSFFFCVYVWNVLFQHTNNVKRNISNCLVFRLCKFSPVI